MYIKRKYICVQGQSLHWEIKPIEKGNISQKSNKEQAIQKQDSQGNNKRKKKEKKLKIIENLVSLSEKVEKEEIKGGKNMIMQAKRKLS